MPSVSNTSDHQRLDEMFIHLTPKGALIPYSLCTDDDGNYWVASKGGLFKFDEKGKDVLFERKNLFPKKVAAYCQVLYYDKMIVYAFAEDQSGLTEFRIFDLSGNMLHEQFIDGKVQSLAVSHGELYLLKQLRECESIIYRAGINCPNAWQEVVSDDEIAFQTICMYDKYTMVAATCSIPINMYSKQEIRVIDVFEQRTKYAFSCAGRKDGEVYFPRAIKRYNNNILVLDKTGRIQEFSLDGEFLRVAAQIDAYLGNGFTVVDDQAVIACSGIVMTKEQKTICDDWVEKINLDGSKWIPKSVDAGEVSSFICS